VTAHKEATAGSEEGSASVLASDPPGAPAEIKLSPAGRRRLFAGLIATAVVALSLAGVCAALWVRNHNQQQSLDAMQRTLTPWRYEPAVAALWSGFLGSNPDTDVVLGDESFLLIQQISKQSVSFNGYLSHSYIGQFQAENLGPDKRFILGMIASKTLGNTSEFKLAQRILALSPLDRNIHLYSARQYMPALVKQDNVILIGGRISNP
jgi:hypothetical protein